ncbi:MULTISPECIES: SDR family NAD(P)-dependent oxidoreductase [unclassified Streptomyces]|uniref:SDR family NAD(P)-dependent oxidoreductase n=1 Tax=unclassified Streptomyces TaxID=2593676 RepID=UPI0037F2AED9
MRRFEGHVAVVTGGGQGIGAATARRLMSEGAAVLLADADGERAAATAAALTQQSDGGGLADAVACDVADQAAVDAAMAHAVDRFGRLDVLVNNAYACHVDPPRFEDLLDADWYEDIEVTLTGAMRCARAALPWLTQAGGRGAIVNIGSVNGHVDFGNHAYSAAKAGLASLTRTLAAHAAPRGVRVNLVAPGTVRTPAWAGREADLERIAEIYPMGRVGEPDDIASAVAFLASGDAGWVTGVVLPVDGGVLAHHAGFARARP